MTTTQTQYRRSTDGSMQPVQVIRYSVAETAKLVRTALKDNFPGVKFSVRGKSYAGGASIDVRWTDGPTSAEVERVAKRYEGATFDGMVDLKSYVTHTGPNGERISYGADFVMCEREYSRSLLEAVAAEIAERYGVPECPVTTWDTGEAHFSWDWKTMDTEPRIGNDWLTNFATRYAAKVAG